MAKSYSKRGATIYVWNLGKAGSNPDGRTDTRRGTTKPSRKHKLKDYG